MAGKYGITADQGATWQHTFTWLIDNVPVDLTDYAARMQLRPTVPATEVEISLTTAAGTITLGGDTGVIALNVPATTTAALTPGVYMYDLEVVTLAGVVTRLLQGTFTISAEVTR